MFMQARSQEARANWETALDAKDRAIAQLEEALASRQRSLVSCAALVQCPAETLAQPSCNCLVWHNGIRRAPQHRLP